ncbi:hypothetical protein PAMP_020926 [Pampus punctatissimus]
MEQKLQSAEKQNGQQPNASSGRRNVCNATMLTERQLDSRKFLSLPEHTIKLLCQDG